MSCGLGAVILVLMLVKEDVQSAHIEADLLQDDLARLERQETELRARLADAKAANADEAGRIETASRALAESDEALKTASEAIATQRAEREALRQSVEQTEIPQQAPDVIETPRTGEENYVIGLRVEGRRIVVLVDASASMTDEKLIDIIRRKNASDAERRDGPKWQRTQRVVEWLIARAPKTSEISVIAFSDSATSLGGAGWHSANDGAAMRRIVDEMKTIVPRGPTNLQAGLKAAAAARPTSVYIVTDGLPTAGDSGYRSLNPFSGCNALWGGSSTISGPCRARLFLHTIDGTPLKGTKVNVVLLPIEGDPDAASLFWRWTSVRDGVTISPAGSWP